MSTNLLELFNEYFEMIPALSDELKDEVYKLRYQVYCIETGFEDPANHLQGLESDEYDNHSVHYLIRHRKSRSFAATTRLIFPDVKNPEKLFPIEKYTKFDKFELLQRIPRDTHLAEASRFCVSKDFKRRKNEAGTLAGISNMPENNYEDERRILPHLSIALFACLIKMSYEHKIYYWYAVMEPALIRFFATLGIYFTAIGPLTEYHGKRQPCIIKVSDLLNGVAQKNIEMWEFMTNKGQFK
ncbi:PEP-CTERM/exosortase system-associated acyltransferase [Candidatus Methylomicrobium oryzae]|uniref:PEP-CTERM/exosortase system-associated acyltransferase n=1 Tax=Candidatus Methylomicrobium oryzae TaxID=2802053 RepID=UPI001922333E|nr:PEP-CTERM/exosortase system-associated acyltransferase [Methylomicrobium sp. RS1]MBL1264944.1 PEP-CTERM/exosortase system-associated acyltransferase [Methylomicrobium sp. RS1]